MISSKERGCAKQLVWERDCETLRTDVVLTTVIARHIDVGTQLDTFDHTSVVVQIIGVIARRSRCATT